MPKAANQHDRPTNTNNNNKFEEYREEHSTNNFLA